MTCRVEADLARKDLDDERLIEAEEMKDEEMRERVEALAAEMMVVEIYAGGDLFWESFSEMDKAGESRLQAAALTALHGRDNPDTLSRTTAHAVLGKEMLKVITTYIYPQMIEAAKSELY
jgi:hypothetical protein